MKKEILKQFIAVRAVIEKDGKILLIRESMKYKGGTNKGKYDFPGGKIHVGESFIDAIRRETKEEVGLNIKIGNPFYVGEWQPIIKGERIQIIGIFFLCKPVTSNIKLSDDHNKFVLISPQKALKLPLIKEVRDAIKVIVKQKMLN